MPLKLFNSNRNCSTLWKNPEGSDPVNELFDRVNSSMPVVLANDSGIVPENVFDTTSQNRVSRISNNYTMELFRLGCWKGDQFVAKQEVYKVMKESIQTILDLP